MFGFILNYRDRGLPDIVIRRPNLPGLNVFSPKQPGIVVLEELPDHSAASASLENANYHAGPEHLAAIISPLQPSLEVTEALAHHAVSAVGPSLFSVSDESEGSSSPGSGASPREQEAERGRLGQVLDRLRSGLNTTIGFERL